IVDSFELALFETTTLKQIARFNSRSPLRGLGFSSRTDLVLIEDGQLKLFDPANLSVLKTIKIENDRYESLVLSPDGRRGAAVTEGRRVVLLDLSRREAETRIGPFQCDIASAAFAPDGKRVAIAAVNGAVSLWTVEGKALASTKISFLYSEERSASLPLLFITDSLMVSGDRDGFIRF